MPFVVGIERQKQNLAVSTAAIDEPIADRDEQIGSLPRSAGREDRYNRVLQQILGVARVVRERECISIPCLE